MRLAYFSPVSPQKTGISNFTEKELLPYLSKHADIDLFIDAGVEPTSRYLKENFSIHCYTDYEQAKGDYDIALYHMGNNVLHEFIYNTLLKDPGVTVLHDIYLHGFLGAISLAKYDGQRYIDEFAHCYGPRGVEVARRAIAAGKYEAFDYPLIGRVVDHSLGVVCQSNIGIETVLEERVGSLATKINHPFVAPDAIVDQGSAEVDELKAALGLKDKHPIIASFGFIASHKRYRVLLEAFKKFLKGSPEAALLLIGDDTMEIDGLIAGLGGLEGSVFRTGYIPSDRISTYVSMADFCINLRYPTAGEASGSVLNLMSMQKAVIVSNVGWFSELPWECCLKLDPDAYEKDVLVEYMKVLTSDEQLRRNMGQNARSYVLREHSPEEAARRYIQFIEYVLTGDDMILGRVSREAEYLAISENDEALLNGISDRVWDLISASRAFQSH
ncbi:MAG TPA: glycosyltransferase family 4 protein [Methanotrichaceae archaeon]|nr:glycosyltransferase family 4 protein [Methanotrichaceae archaeon]